jgi:hypothetical protein
MACLWLVCAWLSMPLVVKAQSATAAVYPQPNVQRDTGTHAKPGLGADTAALAVSGSPLTKPNVYSTPPNPKRVWVVAGLHTGVFGASMILLDKAWYANYPRGKFRTFNDWHEWLQVDKVGHAWSAYQLSRASMATFDWAGVPTKQQVWLGGTMGIVFQTAIEIQDGFSEAWGWSWGDVAANTMGSAMLVAQQLGWQEQRISFKLSFHRMRYDFADLNDRTTELFGKSLPEQMLKDYNGQTYWLSANLKSFFKASRLPPWLNVAVGYGASDMFGALSNRWLTDDFSTARDYRWLTRRRQFYLAPDIDFAKIKTHSKFLRSVFFCLNAFKMPTPALVFSNGKVRLHGLYF